MNYQDIKNQRFGRRLAIARTECGIKIQHDAEDMFNMAQSNLSRYEMGKQFPKDDKIAMFAEKYGVSFDWLKYGDEDEYIIEDFDNMKTIQYNYIKGKKNHTYKNMYKLLSQENKNIIDGLTRALYLDENPDMLQKQLGEDQAEFEKNLEVAKTANRETEWTKEAKKRRVIIETVRRTNHDLYNMYKEKKCSYDDLLKAFLKSTGKSMVAMVRIEPDMFAKIIRNIYSFKQEYCDFLITPTLETLKKYDLRKKTELPKSVSKILDKMLEGDITIAKAIDELRLQLIKEYDPATYNEIQKLSYSEIYEKVLESLDQLLERFKQEI